MKKTNLSLTPLKGEIWKEVVDWEGYYNVSSKGRVMSLDRHIPVNGGIKFQPARILSPGLSFHGYYKVSLCVDKKLKYRSVHRLVAEAFILNPEKKNTVNHKNSRRWDNRLENLEWATEKENSQHAAKKGRIGVKGSKNAYAKVDEKIVLEIREKYASREYYLSELSEIYNIHFGTISYIVRGDTWKHVGGPICRENRSKGSKRYSK